MSNGSGDRYSARARITNLKAKLCIENRQKLANGWWTIDWSINHFKTWHNLDSIFFCIFWNFKTPADFLQVISGSFCVQFFEILVNKSCLDKLSRFSTKKNVFESIKIFVSCQNWLKMQFSGSLVLQIKVLRKVNNLISSKNIEFQIINRIKSKSFSKLTNTFSKNRLKIAEFLSKPALNRQFSVNFCKTSPGFQK